MDKSKKKKHQRQVYWICDKKDCKTSNTRIIKLENVLNDDVCDYCHTSIHEPLLIELNDEQH
jgi:hypothetical protein